MNASYGPITAYTSNFTQVELIASTTISLPMMVWHWEEFVQPIEFEDDKHYQLKIRKLFYAPFHVRPKPLYKAKNLRKRIFIKQIMPKAIRIGRNSA